MNTTRPYALSPDEFATLQVWSSDAANSPRALRAAIVLAVATDDDFSSCTIARRLGIQPSTVKKWSRRFVQERLRGLEDRPRSGAPRRIDPERIAQIVERSLEPTPRDARAWSRRMLAQATGVSRSTVHRIWKALELAPHRHTRAQ